MKVVLGIVGAFVAALAAIFLFANVVATQYMNSSEFQSPDQAGETHSTVYLSVILASVVIGYLIGRFIGARVDRAMARDMADDDV